MPRALMWKQWRELRALRWVCYGLGAASPLVLLAAAEAAVRGWLPFGKLSSYSTGTVLLEVAPAVMALGLWPLVALLMSAQAYAGDRADGTESFLLERPVPRGLVWRTRFLAALGSTAVVVAVTLASWSLLALTLGADPSIGQAWKLFGFAGSLATAAAFLGGVAAASLLRAPLAGVLLGLILGVIPFAVASVFAGFFPFAQYRNLQLGFLVPWLLPAGYVAASFVVLCRGEPAGRGRWLRGGVALGIAAVCVPAAFAMAAPLAMRLNAGLLPSGAVLVPSPGGEAIVAGHRRGGGAWLIDLETGRKRRFLGPPLHGTAWSADGSRLAVISEAGPLGSHAAGHSRLEFYDARGNPTGTIPLPDLWPHDMRWAGDALVLSYFRSRQDTGLFVVSPEARELRQVDFRQEFLTWSLVGPTSSGELFVARAWIDRAAQDAPESSYRVYPRGPYALFRLDLERAALDARPLLEDEGSVFAARDRLSPSGRYWRVDAHQQKDERRPLLDLTNGIELHAEGLPARAVWLQGDRLAWVETAGVARRLMLAEPGAAPRTLKEWSDRDRRSGPQSRDRSSREVRVSAVPSPDRQRLLVTVYRELSPRPANDIEVDERGEATVVAGMISESLVYDAVEDRWTELPIWPEFLLRGTEHHRTWAGPRTIARTATGFLALEDLARPGEVRTIIGRDG